MTELLISTSNSYQSISDLTIECPICLEEIDNKLSFMTECNHSWCQNCNTKLNKNNIINCPICKKEFIPFIKNGKWETIDGTLTWKRGILDKTHKRLFTFSTLKSLLVQNDFKITKSYGIPAPFPLAVGENFLSKILININTFLIKISKNLFSFQIFYEVKPNISLETLLDRARENIEKKN